MEVNAMSNRTVIVVSVLSLWLVGCGTTVAPGTMGLKWRPMTAGLSDKPVREGFYLHLPWNDVFTYSVQWQSFTEKVDVLTRDDLHIQIQASVLVRPVAQELYRLQLDIGQNFYPSVVKPEFLTVARNTVAEYLLVEIPEKSPEIEAKILERLKARIEGKHLELDNVTISDIDFTSGVLRAIEAKLAKEQEVIQKGFELEITGKEAEIARARAQGEGDAIKIRAQGEAEAQKIRAAGQAEAQKLIDQTLTPRFLQFKAFDSPNSKFIYVPTGKDGLPIIVRPEEH